MIDWKTRVEARRLLAVGLSKTAVAAELGVARRTLYNWIAEGWLDGDEGDEGDGARAAKR